MDRDGREIIPIFMGNICSKESNYIYIFTLKLTYHIPDQYENRKLSSF